MGPLQLSHLAQYDVLTELPKPNASSTNRLTQAICVGPGVHGRPASAGGWFVGPRSVHKTHQTDSFGHANGETPCFKFGWGASGPAGVCPPILGHGQPPWVGDEFVIVLFRNFGEVQETQAITGRAKCLTMLAAAT